MLYDLRTRDVVEEFVWSLYDIFLAFRKVLLLTLDLVKLWMRRIGSLLLVSAIYGKKYIAVLVLLQLNYIALILTGCLETPGIYLAEITSPRELNTTSKAGNDTLDDITIRFGYFGKGRRDAYFMIKS